MQFKSIPKFKMRNSKFPARKLLSLPVFATAAIISVALSVAIFNLASTPVQAAVPSWDKLTNIFYDSTQEDPDNGYLKQAATELKTHLEQSSSLTFTITTASPPSTGIYLSVNPSHPDLTSRNEEAFKLLSDSTGLHVIGKSPVAVRHGAYTLLEKLGYRRYFEHPAWEIHPDKLISLDGTNEMHEPPVLTRVMSNPAIYREPHKTYEEEWRQWNRMSGYRILDVAHSYYSIIDSALYATRPELFCGEPIGVDGWQLNIDNPDVLIMVIDYAKNFLNVNPGDGIVSISPNDGGGYCWDDNNYQLTTNKVLWFANEVAKAIKTEFPDKYVGVYNYAQYSCLPSFDLEENLFVAVTIGYNYCGLNIVERLLGLQTRGAITGIRDYYNVGKSDRPMRLDALLMIPRYTDLGVRAIKAETTADSWGSSGLFFYIASHLYWEPNLDINAIEEEFYEKAFGSAKDVMKRYYEKWNSGQPVMDRTLALAYRDLEEAQVLAADNPEIMPRIRHIQYYLRLLWNWWLPGRLEGMTLDEMKDFYRFVCKVQDIAIIDGRRFEAKIRNDYLIDKFGMADNEVRAMCDITLPTDTESQAWFAEGLAYFAGVDAVEVKVIDPFTTSLVPLESDVPKESIPGSRTHSIILPSIGGETVTLQVRGDVDKFTLIYPDRISSVVLPGVSSTSFQPIEISLPDAGTYQLITTWKSGGNDIYLDIPDRPAAFLAGPDDNFIWSTSLETNYKDPYAEFYFYVPQNTNAFILAANVALSYRPIAVTLELPSGTTNKFTSAEVGFNEWTFENPEPGLWKIKLTQTGGGSFYLMGIPPLVWHDPEYLLVPAGSSISLITGDLNKDGKVDIYDVSRLLSKWGSTALADLAEVDINAGPNNVSANKIDLYDANKMMVNWTGS